MFAKNVLLLIFFTCCWVPWTPFLFILQRNWFQPTRLFAFFSDSRARMPQHRWLSICFSLPRREGDPRTHKSTQNASGEVNYFVTAFCQFIPTGSVMWDDWKSIRRWIKCMENKWNFTDKALSHLWWTRLTWKHLGASHNMWQREIILTWKWHMWTFSSQARRSGRLRGQGLGFPAGKASRSILWRAFSRTTSNVWMWTQTPPSGDARTSAVHARWGSCDHCLFLIRFALLSTYLSNRSTRLADMTWSLLDKTFCCVAISQKWRSLSCPSILARCVAWRPCRSRYGRSSWWRSGRATCGRTWRRSSRWPSCVDTSRWMTPTRSIPAESLQKMWKNNKSQVGVVLGHSQSCVHWGGGEMTPQLGRMAAQDTVLQPRSVVMHRSTNLFNWRLRFGRIQHKVALSRAYEPHENRQENGEHPFLSSFPPVPEDSGNLLYARTSCQPFLLHEQSTRWLFKFGGALALSWMSICKLKSILSTLWAFRNFYW